jgi:hypothetical protein
VKAASILGLALYCSYASAQNSLLINEVQAANDSTISTSIGTYPDWIEIYNPTSRSLDMAGMRLVVPGHIHVVDAPLKVPAKSFKILWCDGSTDQGADHLSFKLSRNGGSVILVASDGVTMIDVFTWPALYADESIGRHPDGSRDWKIFPTPTPGRSNSRSIGSTSRPPPIIAIIEEESARKQLTLAAGDNEIRYSADGSDPLRSSAYMKPITIARTTSIRARAFDRANVAGPEYARTIYVNEPLVTAAIILDSLDLWDKDNGIGTNGPTANYSRTGREWERRAFFQLGDTVAAPIGIRISGSGSRSLPKHSFKLYARSRYGTPENALRDVTGASFNELMLRADAGPNAFLRNYLMERIVVESGLELAVQRSRPLPLLINGNYHGLYRLMPPKDAEWIRHITGSQDVDVLDGPGYEVISGGSNAHFLRGLQHLKSSAPIDTLLNYFDLQSLIDLACIDVFTGRGDHDLNVRVYRPEKGVWRWVIFDLDLWAPVEENSLERMLSANTLESPYLPEIIAHPELQRMFMSRMAALLAGPFSPLRTIPQADSIHRTYADELRRDHDRWSGKLDRPGPEETLEEMKQFLAERGNAVIDHIADRAGKKSRKVIIEVPDRSKGSVQLDNLPLAPGKQEVMLFENVPMTLSIQPAPGTQFLGWTGTKATGTSITFDPKSVRMLRPRLR